MKVKSVEIEFIGVHELVLENFENLLKVTIDIIDISSFQLEGIKYKVSECENNLFSFMCNDILIS